jgi:thioredoxin reductase (NADPH)
LWFSRSDTNVQAAYQIINPGKKYVLKYTTVAGVDGFDGTRKESKKQWLRPLFNILNSNKKI